MGGALIRFDDKAKTFVTYTPDSRDPHKLNGGGITSHPRRPDWNIVGGSVGWTVPVQPPKRNVHPLHGKPGPAEQHHSVHSGRWSGRLWLSTQKGISRFDPQTETFRNYDVSDGLQSNEFSRRLLSKARMGRCSLAAAMGSMRSSLKTIRDNPYVPPVVITSFKIFNKPVPIGAKSVLKKAIPYVDSLTLSYRDNVFSFEFAALSYANSHKNRYRYKLENFDPGWNEVGSKQRLATYTNLDPGKYVFRVQGSNSDGVWNEEGVSLPILITPPWWRTNWFRALCAAVCSGTAVGGVPIPCPASAARVQHDAGGARRERTRIARELHDTLLQSFHGLLLRFQTASYLLPDRPAEAKEKLDRRDRQAAKAITEGRDAVQGLRASTVERNDLALAIRTLGDELATDASAHRLLHSASQSRARRAICTRSFVTRSTRLRRKPCGTAFRHAQAGRVEVEIRYDSDEFRLRVRDDGKGSIKRFSRPRESRDTTDCAACRNAPR